MIFKTETGNKNGNEILIGPNIPMIESRFFWLSHTFEIGGITILDIRSRVRVRVCINWIFILSDAPRMT